MPDQTSEPQREALLSALVERDLFQMLGLTREDDPSQGLLAVQLYTEWVQEQDWSVEAVDVELHWAAWAQRVLVENPSLRMAYIERLDERVRAEARQQAQHRLLSEAKAQRDALFRREAERPIGPDPQRRTRGPVHRPADWERAARQLADAEWRGEATEKHLDHLRSVASAAGRRYGASGVRRQYHAAVAAVGHAAPRYEEAFRIALEVAESAAQALQAEPRKPRERWEPPSGSRPGRSQLDFLVPPIPGQIPPGQGRRWR